MALDDRADNPFPRRVADFQVKFSQFLNADAEGVQPLPDFAKDKAILLDLYRAMLRTRLFDQKAIALQRTGQLGTYASSLGQEAVSVGFGSAMRPEDVLLPAYREYGAQFWRGVTMTEILLYWGGNEQGMNFKGPRRDFPICVPIATHAPHAVGVAYAMQLRHQARVAVCALGDGATSKGDFYEALNGAGVWRLPLVFIVVNNGWAISLPRKKQSAALTLAQKAIAAGFSGEQVDGNDVIAVRYCAERALEKARQGGGPSLIEALTYRLSDHTTADDASRYRSAKALEEQWQYEPLRRLRGFLLRQGYWREQDDRALKEALNGEVEEAVRAYLDTPRQAPESMFDYLYQEWPAVLQAQRQSVLINPPGADK